MSWIILVPFVSFVINTLLLASLARIWLRTVVGRIFGGFLAATGLWGLFSWMMHADVPPSPLFWLRMEIGLPTFAMTFMMHMSTQFPRPKQRTTPIVLTWYAWGALIILLDIAGLLVKDVQVIPNTGGMVSIQFGQWMPVVWLYVLATVIGSATLYFHSYFKKPLHHERSDLRYPILGTIVVFSGVLLNAVPGLSGYPFDLLANLMFSLIVAYGVVRHQFLTPGIILRRSVFYLAIALALNGAYVGMIGLIQRYNAQIGDVELWLLLVPVALLLVIASQPLRKMFQVWMDRLFLGQQYGYEKALQQISSTTASVLNMDELAPAIVKAVLQAFDCRNAAIFALNTEQSALEVKAVAGERSEVSQGVSIPVSYPGLALLQRHNLPVCQRDLEIMLESTVLRATEKHGLNGLEYEWLVPLVCRRRLVGILTLGPKRGQRPYFADDIAVVSAISNQLAVNIENARLYSDLQKAYLELRSAQDSLIRSERTRAVGQVTAGIAHDFNNILTAVLSRTEMALERATDGRVKSDLEIVLKAAQDGAAIVRKLQGYVRQQGVEGAAAIDINQIVKDALSMAEHRIADRREKSGIFIDTKLDLNTVGPVRGEPADLRQALLNLLFNAIDAMPAGGRLGVSTREQAGWIAISVRDTGIGIAPESRQNLFKPFFTTKGAQGTGLGLSVAQLGVDRSGGRIDVESEPGKGSTFTVRLPVSAPVAGPHPPPCPEVEMSTGRVLVIEDSKEVGESIKAALTEQGYRLTLAHAGVEGLASFQSGPFDAVICDWGLPDMTGGDVALSVQRIRPGTPVLLVTGWNVELDENQRKSMGIVGIVNKPFTGERLIEAVSSLFPRDGDGRLMKSGVGSDRVGARADSHG
ncbi:MAG: response regulator [Chloroflexi bacterium]|nr:response regulator [Chloroflexota bacterium]